jgi:small neutral amino acid transporter SnatA (MarC family)
VSKDIVARAKKIVDVVMKRISEAFNYILELGEQMLQGFLNFFGINVDNVKVSGGGKYPLL